MINIISIAIVWFFSPFVFIPLYIIYCKKYHKEHEKNNYLSNQIKNLLNKENMSKEDIQNITDQIDLATPDISKSAQPFNKPNFEYNQQPILNSIELKQNNIDKVYTRFEIIQPRRFKQNNNLQRTKKIKADKNSNSVSTINIVLIVGVIFIVLAGIAFATTTWQNIHNFFRTIIIFSVTVLFFGVSILSEKKLKLEKTSIAFYFLGSIFLPICMISVGFFKLFGNWLSLSGDGKYLLLLLSSILLGTAGFIGTQKYNMKSLAYIFYSCITISIICLMKQMHFNSNIFVLCLAIISTIIIFTVSHISKKESEKYSVLLSCINIFAIFNTVTLGAISILISENTAIASLSTFAFAFIFLKNIFNSGNKNYGVFPFVALIIIGLYKLIIPENISDYMMLITATAVTLALVGKMGQLNAKLAKLLHIISIIMVAFSFLIFDFPLSLSNSWTGITLLAAAIMLFNLTWLSLKYKNKSVLSFQPLLLITLIQGFASYIIDSTCFVCIIVSVCSLLAFILYKKLKFLRTNSSNAIFAFTPLICMLVSFGTNNVSYITSIKLFRNYGFYMLICSTVFVLLISLIIFEKNKFDYKFNKVYDWILPLSISTILCSIYSMSEKNGQMYFFIYFAIIILCTIFTIIFENKKKIAKRFNECLEIYSVSLILISVIISVLNFNINYIYPYFWIASISFAIKAYISHKKGNVIMRNVFFYLVSCFIIGASVITTFNITNEKLLCVLVPTAVTICSLLCYILYTKILGKEIPISFQLETFFAMATAIQSITLMFILANEQTVSIVYFVFCAISIIASYFMFLIRKKNIFAFIPILIIYPFISESFIKSGLSNYNVFLTITSILMFVLIAFLARIIHKKIMFINNEKSVIIDWLTILNVFVVFNVNLGQYSRFIVMCIFTIYSLLFFNRTAKKTANPCILTSACFFGVLTFWEQPFFRIIDVIKEEVNVIPVLLFCVAFSFIWKNNKKLVNRVCFSISLISIVYFLLDVMIYELLIDSLILANAMLIMIVISFVKKTKKWFVLSASVLIFLTIYMSRNFWLSLEWWIYLLSTGTILIVIASINEIQKQKGDSLKIKASRFMSEWKW